MFIANTDLSNIKKTFLNSMQFYIVLLSEFVEFVLHVHCFIFDKMYSSLQKMQSTGQFLVSRKLVNVGKLCTLKIELFVCVSVAI